MSTTDLATWTCLGKAPSDLLGERPGLALLAAVAAADHRDADRPRDHEAIIVRTPAFYAKSRSVGHMSSYILVPGKSETIVSGFPEIPERDIVILAASIETVIALAGRRDVKSKGERTPDGARFLTSWRA